MDRPGFQDQSDLWRRPTPLAGHFFVINRRYDEGIQYYRKALEIKPDLWEARAELGVNLMRFGQNAEARQNLEACFNANYSSPLVRNTLKLLDSIDKNVETFTTPTTVLKLDKKEARLLRPYFQAELDRAMATYEKRYHTRSPARCSWKFILTIRISKFAPWGCRDWERWA